MAAQDSIPTAPPNDYYKIRAIPCKGYGCFALQPLKRGTRILADAPLLTVTMAEYMLCDVASAFEALTPKQRALYFSLHSGHGQNPKAWPSQIHYSVGEKERQRISEQHKARTGTEASLISIFQTNCMERDKGAAVFPHAARFNHACNPNACFTWNGAIGRETIHIMNDVGAGEEITLSYCDMIHDKMLRVWELKHYGFVCDCRSCVGEEQLGSWAHQSAQRRFRLQELERETRHLRGKNLENGLKEKGFVEKLVEMAKLHMEEGDYTTRLASVFLDIALICEVSKDLRMAEVAAGKALQVKKDCQGTDFPDFHKYAGVWERIRAKRVLMRA